MVMVRSNCCCCCWLEQGESGWRGLFEDRGGAIIALPVIPWYLVRRSTIEKSTSVATDLSAALSTNAKVILADHRL